MSGMVNIKLFKVVIYGSNVKVDETTLNFYSIPFWNVRFYYNVCISLSSLENYKGIYIL